MFINLPYYLDNLLIPLEIKKSHAKKFVRELLLVKGIKEARLHFEESIAYLKVDNQNLETDTLQNLLLRWSTAE